MVRNKIMNKYHVTRADHDFDGIIALKLQNKQTKFNVLLIGAYLPPETSVYGDDPDRFFQELVSLIYENTHMDAVFLMGDYNARVGSKKDVIDEIDSVPERIVLDTQSNDHGTSLINFLLQANACIVNGRINPLRDSYTSVSHRGKAVVDYVLACHDSLEYIKNFEVLGVSELLLKYQLMQHATGLLSDHSLLSFTIMCSNIEPLVRDIAGDESNNTQWGHSAQNAHVGASQPKRFKIHCVPDNFMYTGATVDSCLKIIEELLLNQIDQERLDSLYDQYVETYFDEMSSFFKEVSNTPVSRKSLRFTPKPYWNEDLSELWKRFHRSEKIFVTTRKDDPAYSRILGDFRDKRRAFDKRLKREKRSYQRRKVYDLEKANTKNPKEFWRTIENLGPKRKRKIPNEVILEDGSTTDVFDDVLSKWKRDFQGLLTTPAPESQAQQDFLRNITEGNDAAEASWNDDNVNAVLNVPITKNEIYTVLFNCKSGKAPGLDGIVADTIKNRTSVNVLSALFNTCFETHMMPSIWAKAIIAPIPKAAAGDPRTPLNYRGISLLSVVSKVYSGVISNRISKHLESNGLLANEQNGFRPMRSCMDHIFSLYDICKVRKNLKQDTFLTFIDFKKAFDCVQHQFLLHKLREKDITGNIYHSVKTMYSAPLSCVRVGGHLTDMFPITAGVRQGDSLSPTLFSIFVDDLAEEIRSLSCGIMVGGLQVPLLLYADDVVLMAPTEHAAQMQLDKLNEWCQKWWMSINPAKSKAIHVRNPQKPRCQEILTCGEDVIEFVDVYKYLGVYFHEHLSFKPTVEALTASASRSFGRVVNMFKKLQNMGIRTYETLYTSYVAPIMSYGAGVWGFAEHTDPQVLQNRIIRYFLGVHKFAPLPAIYLEMDWMNTRFVRWLEIIRYRNRLAAMNEDRLPRIVYDWDRSLDTEAWAKSADFILEYVNMSQGGGSEEGNEESGGDEEENEEDVDMLKHVDLDVVKARLMRINREKWWTSAADMPKLRTFQEIYDDQDYKGIVYSHLSRRQRSLVVKFKSGILPLGLETGRFNDTPLENRLCCICEDSLLDDEYHFLLYCEGLKDIRSKHFAKHTYLEDVEDPTDKVELCKMLLNTHNLRNTARFLEEMFDSRLKLLYKP